MITPTSEAALVDAVKGADGPLRVIGGGTRPIGRPVAGETLSAAGLTGVSLYEPGAMTLIASAGTPVSEIEAVLDAENQQLAFEPMDHRTLLGTDGTPTIGGVVAGNVSGPRRLQVGACRDHLLGVRFVDGAGRTVSNGGRVMKNVTGYDLVKLLAGSRGTLGVLTEVSLKVMPKAEASATICVNGCDFSRGHAAMTRAMGSPFDVNGAAMIGDAVYLRVEGFEGSVGYRAEQISALVNGEVVEDASIWKDIRDVAALKDHDVVWHVAMAPSAMFEGLLGKTLGSVSFDHVIDWAGGRGWIGVKGGDAESLHNALQAAVADPEINGGGGGHVTLYKAPEELRASLSVFQPEPTPLKAISDGLRQKFDPRGRLNPGLMA